MLAVYDAAPQPGITFRRCAEQYIESHRPGWSNPKHAAQWSATLQAYAYPVLGNIAVDKISNGDGTDLVMKVLQPIWYRQDRNGIPASRSDRVGSRLGQGAWIPRR